MYAQILYTTMNTLRNIARMQSISSLMTAHCATISSAINNLHNIYFCKVLIETTQWYNESYETLYQSLQLFYNNNKWSQSFD